MVKPLPAAVRTKLQEHRKDSIGSMEEVDKDFDYLDTEDAIDSLFASSYQHRRTNENDDYAFLDEDILKDEGDVDVKESLQRRYRQKSETISNRGFNMDSENRSRSKGRKVQLIIHIYILYQ